MSLALFTFCLPVLLGYILFVGVSGRLDPLSRPRHLAERPSWALGLWVGLAVAAVLMVGLHLAYDSPIENGRALLAPSAWALAALLLPGLAAWFAYRGSIARALDAEAWDHRAASLERARIASLPLAEEEPAVVDPRLLEEEATAEATEAADPAEPLARTSEAPGSDSPLVAAFLDVGGPGQLDIPDIPVAEVDGPDTDADDARGAEAIALTESAPAAPFELPPAGPIVIDAIARDVHEIELGAAEDLSGLLCQALGAEEALREETEKHLRITRRALAKLEAESRERENEKTEVLIALEEELESRIRESATAEARATRETARRIEVETTIVALKQDVLAARRDLRRGTEARAKALSAATRAIALTRQAVRARARLERKLRETEDTLADREATLSSVIRALEKEKGRTREEIGALARQLVLHEKQMRARRGLEEVARNVEGKLTTRLARKVARARPLVPSS